jgi:hypothetical protein
VPAMPQRLPGGVVVDPSDYFWERIDGFVQRLLAQSGAYGCGCVRLRPAPAVEPRRGPPMERQGRLAKSIQVDEPTR